MVTGKATVTYDGDNYNYYFQTNGAAYDSIIVDGTLYGNDGERVDAEDGNTYEVLSFTGVIDVKNGDPIEGPAKIIINSNGKVKKSGTVKIDGVKYTVKDYVVIGETSD